MRRLNLIALSIGHNRADSTRNRVRRGRSSRLPERRMAGLDPSVQPFLRAEPALVFERRAVLHAVAEVDVSETPVARVLQRAQDVQGAQGQVGPRRTVV